MPSSIRNSFFDTAIYYMKKNDLVYTDFFYQCLEERYRKRNSFMIMVSTNNQYLACCKDFIEILLKYQTLDSIKHKLVLKCFLFEWIRL